MSAINGMPERGLYTPEDVREILFELDIHKRYGNKLEKYVLQLVEALQGAGIDIPEKESNESTPATSGHS